MDAEGAIAQAIRDALGVQSVDAALVLGSGWGNLLDSWEVSRRVDYASVGLRQPVADGHEGTLGALRIGETDVLVFSGRTHVYEGHGAAAASESIRVAACLGARVAVLTNANGSLRPQWPLGQIVALTDHLNFAGLSPLSGPRFVDLTNVYDPQLREAFICEAESIGVVVQSGVYAMFPGPHYETAAEAKAAAILGADVLGMSTVMEAIEARAQSMRVLAVSTVTAHEASGESIDPDEVIAIAAGSVGRVAPALWNTLKGISA